MRKDIKPEEITFTERAGTSWRPNIPFTLWAKEIRKSHKLNFIKSDDYSKSQDPDEISFVEWLAYKRKEAPEEKLARESKEKIRIFEYEAKYLGIIKTTNIDEEEETSEMETDSNSMTSEAESDLVIESSSIFTPT